jgi:hypothetical protein
MGVSPNVYHNKETVCSFTIGTHGMHRNGRGVFYLIWYSLRHEDPGQLQEVPTFPPTQVSEFFNKMANPGILGYWDFKIFFFYISDHLILQTFLSSSEAFIQIYCLAKLLVHQLTW